MVKINTRQSYKATHLALPDFRGWTYLSLLHLKHGLGFVGPEDTLQTRRCMKSQLRIAAVACPLNKERTSHSIASSSDAYVGSQDLSLSYTYLGLLHSAFDIHTDPVYS